MVAGFSTMPPSREVVLGKNNTVYPYAMIGGLTHDLKYEGGDPAF